MESSGKKEKIEVLDRVIVKPLSNANKKDVAGRIGVYRVAKTDANHAARRPIALRAARFIDQRLPSTALRDHGRWNRCPHLSAQSRVAAAKCTARTARQCWPWAASNRAAQ